MLPVVGLLSGDAPYFRFALSRALPALDETAEIKAAVTDFNNRFMDIYASQGAQRGIDHAPATVGMRHRLIKDAGFLQMGERVLIYDIAALEIRSVKRDGPVGATVVAAEDWNYQYKNDKSWQHLADVHGTGALYRYTLVQQQGDWLVQKYEPVREGKGGA